MQNLLQNTSEASLMFFTIGLMATLWLVYEIITGSWQRQAQDFSMGYHNPPNLSASKIFQMPNALAFFVGFGWYGFSAFDSFPFWGIIINSIAVGCFFVGFSLLILWVLSTSEHNAHSPLIATIGATGEVMGFVPSRRRGFGKVKVTYAGRTDEFEAITNLDFGIPYGAPVTVVGIDGDRLIVR